MGDDPESEFYAALVPGIEYWDWEIEHYGETWIAYRQPPEDNGSVVGVAEDEKGIVAACNQPETKLGGLGDDEEVKKFVNNADDWAVIPARCPMCDGEVKIGLRPLQTGKKRRYVCPHCGKIFTKTVDSVSTDNLNKRAEIKFTDGSHSLFDGGLMLYEKYPGELADRMKMT